MGVNASQITSLTVVYSDVYSGVDQRKHQSSASLAFVRGIHRGPMNFPHKWPVTQKMFPFDDVIMWYWQMYQPEINTDLNPSWNNECSSINSVHICTLNLLYYLFVFIEMYLLNSWGAHKPSEVSCPFCYFIYCFALCLMVKLSSYFNVPLYVYTYCAYSCKTTNKDFENKIRLNRH